MISDRTIICVANNWQMDPTSKHHVMRLLARRNRVVWVNYHGTRRPTMSVTDLRSTLGAMSRVLRGPRRISASMVQTTPFVLPAIGNGLLGRLNQRAMIAQIRRVLRRYKLFALPPVQLWTFAPDVAFLAGQFDEERFVYYCVDEYAQFEGFDVDALGASERRLLQHVDVVITSSQALFEAKRTLHPNVHLVRHGVDVEHFSRALTPGLERPKEMKGFTGPVIGFFGLVHHWIDVDLLVDVAHRLPHAQFVLIGQVFADVNGLRALPNVHLLGRRPYADLPAYCAAFDVAILPFKRNEFSRYINPIKLREYLAAGLPVVSTPIPEAEIFAPEVTLAAGAEAFAQACRDAIERSCIQDRVRRSASMAGETWDTVVQRLSAIVMGRPESPAGGAEGSQRSDERTLPFRSSLEKAPTEDAQREGACVR